MFKNTILWTLFSGVIVMANVVMAGNESSGQLALPLKYQLEDVRISVLHQTGHRIPGSYQINISGNGKASYVLDKKEKTVLTLNIKPLALPVRSK